jgi:hypothetical protein
MSAMELYELLDKAGLKWDLVEIFEGVRLIRVEVVEEKETEDE